MRKRRLVPIVLSFIKWFKRMMEEPDGKTSFKRVAIVSLLSTFIISYLKIAIPSQQLLDIPNNWMFLFGGAILGMGFISKMNQK